MSKRALLVGINHYDQAPALSCCINDADAMAALLSRHHDGSPNFDCQTLNSAHQRIDEAELRGKIREAFSGVAGGEIVIYFSGHGMVTDSGGYLVTQDGRYDDHGYPMSELLQVANQSGAQSVLIILDCCHSGSIGGSQYQQQNQVTLSEGVTILAASGAEQESGEGMEHSIFTGLLLDAMNGGAADIRGRVSAASMYAHVEQALGAWQQRPMYKSHAMRLNPVRMCEAAVDDSLLRELPGLFPSPKATLAMDPSYEHSFEDVALPENVAKFDKFKILRNARLLETSGGEDLYFAAENSGAVQLTPLGKFYWQLSVDKRL